jgi:mannose-6-phosphate isomerase-like protein (cupin superfamily)
MDTTTMPVAQPFSLMIERLASGKSEALLGQADELEMRIKVYAEGGENTLHAHLDHDHSFVVLEGQASFFDKDGTETVLGKYAGIMLPRGTHYRFCNSGDGNLVLLRAGGGHKPKQGYARAIGKTGPATPRLTPENSKRTGVPIPGEYFGGAE